MPTDRLWCIITTIQEPTPSIRALVASLDALAPGAELVIIGDKKGPARFDLPSAGSTNLRFLPLVQQSTLPFELAAHLPTGHYARKNLGYLLAFQNAAPCIFETDDDNAPNEHWRLRAIDADARTVTGAGWCNVYAHFTSDLIWPRGLPLDEIRKPVPALGPVRTGLRCPIQQGLADLSPDVDAVWRLILDREFTFDRRDSVWLAEGQWCPFNSQSTWWWPEAYPLMYLPAYCSFRMTDIWRSFIAQRCLWAMGRGLVFHAAESVQQRNLHNLQRDFDDEVPGYTGNRRLCAALADTRLDEDPAALGDNLFRCYERLVTDGFFPAAELELVRAWLADVRRTMHTAHPSHNLQPQIRIEPTVRTHPPAPSVR